MQRPVLPRSPRQPYSSTAVIYSGNDQITCRIINISESGVLLYAPKKQRRGAFLRMNLTLPGVERVLDVDGVVSREGERKGQYALAIKFYQPTGEFKIVLATFLCWYKEQRNKKKEKEKKEKKRAPAARKPTAAPGPGRPP